MAKKIFETGTGKMEVLCYEKYNPPKHAFNSYLGVRLIACFEGNDSFGQNGDRITFIQLLKDTFCGQKKSEIESRKAGGGIPEKHYTWKLNKEAVFTEGDTSEKEELDWTIDQLRKSSGNADFRYTEKRMQEDDPMSSQNEKVERLLGLSEEELLSSGFGMLRGKTEEEKKAYIEEHMFSDTAPLPHIVFSAEKKDGKWEKARMADTPCAPCDERKVHEGGQEFQIAVLHESSGGEKEIIGTLFWGWKYNKAENSADLLELQFQIGSTNEISEAVAAWNAKEGYIKINGLSV